MQARGNAEATDEKVRVFMIQANDFASGYYRMEIVAEWLKKYSTKIEVDFYKRGEPAKNLLWRMGGADIVMFQLQVNTLIAQIIPICKANGIKVVMDMDDDLLNVPEWNPAYFMMGRKFLPFHKEPTTGAPMDLKKNKERLENLTKMLRDVDLITLTGKGLRNEYSKFNKVKIIPNAIDPTIVKESKRSGGLFDKKLRIFWQGSPTHAADLHSIKNVIQTITNKYPHVEWVVWGSQYEDFAKWMEIESDRVVSIPTVPFKDYYKKLASLKMDIGIAPLADHDYNKCKSNIKWIEYAMCGIPAVCSDIVTYSDSVQHGKTGFLAHTWEDWVVYLSDLIEQPELRELIAAQAKEQVLQDFNIENTIKRWEEVFLSLHQSNQNKI
jgi:glycosyltransferase involved in cell wall biosynthesis